MEADGWFNADERMRLLHCCSRLRFALLPRDLRIEYIGPMTLWPWRVVCGSASGQLLLRDPDGLCCLSGKDAGFHTNMFVRVRGPHNNIVSNGRMIAFYGRRGLYGGYYYRDTHDMASSDHLLGQSNIVCITVHSWQRHTLFITVMRPRVTPHRPIDPATKWFTQSYRVNNVPLGYRVVLWQDSPEHDILFWDGQRNIRRVTPRYVDHHYLSRTPVSITEVPGKSDSICLTYAAGDIELLELKNEEDDSA